MLILRMICLETGRFSIKTNKKKKNYFSIHPKLGEECRGAKMQIS